jgi:ribosomal protein S18 acetylase RimI-like enzyme
MIRETDDAPVDPLDNGIVIQLRVLNELPPAALDLLSSSGYVAYGRYQVSKSESDQETVIRLRLEVLTQPYVKQFAGVDDWLLPRYREMPRDGFCVGAFHGEKLVGLALGEPQLWNRTLWVWEMAVTAGYQRQGIGRQLLDELAERARAAGLRTLTCETQSTNLPAIRFYRRVGFLLEGVDLSYYTNQDWFDGEVAVFMKRRLD